MDEILEDFKSESKSLVEELTEILDKIEENFEQRGELEQYGQIIDRIMGGAQSLEMALDTEDKNVTGIGQYAQICKIVSYKASQIDNPTFYDAVIAFLQDATEMLEEMVEFVGTEKTLQEMLNQTFLDRLQWISEKFGAGLRASVATDSDMAGPQSQGDIDALLKQLGVN